MSKNLIPTIHELAAIVAVDLDALHPSVRVGRASAQREAKDQLDLTLATYRKEVVQNAFAFFVLGEPGQVEEFVDVAREEAGDIIIANSGSLYTTLAQVIESALGPAREFTPGMYPLAVSVLRDVLIPLNVAEVGAPSLGPEPVKLPDQEATFKFARKFCLEAGGIALDRTVLEDEVYKEALYMDVSNASLVPVIVRGADAADVPELAKLFGRGHMVVQIRPDAQVGSGYVLSKFSAAKELMRSAKEEE